MHGNTGYRPLAWSIIPHRLMRTPGSSLLPFNIITIIEIKKKTLQHPILTKLDIGQTCEYLHTILQFTPDRQVIYGLLTNFEIGIVIRGSVKSNIDDPFEFETQFEIYQLSIADDLNKILWTIIHLNNQTYNRLPYKKNSSATLSNRCAWHAIGHCHWLAPMRTRAQQVPIGTHFEFNVELNAISYRSILGRGSHSLVFKTQINENDKKVLHKWKNGNTYLLFTPVGEPVKIYGLSIANKKQRFNDLYEQLRLAHANSYIHRDIRQANIISCKIQENPDENPILIKCSYIDEIMHLVKCFLLDQCDEMNKRTLAAEINEFDISSVIQWWDNYLIRH
ncbi:unnamed protein product [Didymodactylos carnosus]|uniref:Protein kinase domain-containing protein n=1 Tax=Didymodactylos carnosus TaxID=1234261 RepID=A0A815JP91_9BILA|nr:unnamed protein product [Didymodactylos carnosus]CAF4272794.1 unnamed protein product [Didymodactylos carnosus]